MATATKSSPRSHLAKQRLAVRLTSLCDDDVRVSFEPSCFHSDESNLPTRPSQGHQWLAMFDDPIDDSDCISRFWIDDREGSVQSQLAGQLVERANLLMAIAAKLDGDSVKAAAAGKAVAR